MTGTGTMDPMPTSRPTTMSSVPDVPAPIARPELFPGIGDWGHRPHLDGLRSIAVYAVVLFHAGVARFQGGFVGVDLFFVLSGYLITSLLVSEMATTGRVDILGFYSRRVRRLLPASLVVIVGVCLVLLATTPMTKRFRYLDDAQSALLYFSNWSLIERESNYFSFGRAPSPFLHFWSLSLEEQFYIVFPVVMALLVMLLAKRSKVSTIAGPLAVVMVGSVAAQLYWRSENPIRAYYGTDARVYQILAGSLLAVALLSRPAGLRIRRVARWVAMAGLTGFVLLSTDVLDVDVSVRGLLATASSVALLIGLEAAPTGWLTRTLARRPLVRLGQISYGTYLFHWPLTVLMLRTSSVSPWLIACVVAVGATAAAAISSALIETPVRRSVAIARRRFASVAVGLSISVIAFVVVTPTLLESTRRPIYPRPATPDARLGEQGRTPVPDGLDFRTALADQAEGVSCADDQPQDCLLHDGGDMTVLIVGDSHARMLLPGIEQLAADHQFTLYANIVPGCPWQTGYVGTGRPKAARDQCIDRRQDWYSGALPAIDPDLVVFVSYPYNLGKDLDLIDDSVSELDNPGRYTALSTRTLQLVEQVGAESIVIAPVPVARFDPLDCLSGAKLIGECVFAAGAPPVVEELLAAAVNDVQGAHLVDIDQIACTDLPDCYPIEGDVIVRRDDSHLTAAYVLTKTDDLWTLLTPYLTA